MKKILAMLLSAVILLSFASCNGAGGSEAGYKAAVDLLTETQYGGETDKLEKLAPEDFWEFYETSYSMPRKSMLDEAAWAVESTNQNYKTVYGENYTASADITEANKADSELISKIGAAFGEQKGIAADRIKDAYTLKVKVTLSGTTSSEEEIEVQVVKIDDSWFCCTWYIYDEGSYVSFAIESFVSG